MAGAVHTVCFCMDVGVTVGAFGFVFWYSLCVMLLVRVEWVDERR